ncbi:MAG: hypothetical protein M3N52_06755, partial [Actinomycetota bacterium]|nr:hypothetical protein [Actinomycetota bacterium]
IWAAVATELLRDVPPEPFPAPIPDERGPRDAAAHRRLGPRMRPSPPPPQPAPPAPRTQPYPTFQPEPLPTPTYGVPSPYPVPQYSPSEPGRDPHRRAGDEDDGGRLPPVLPQP